MHRSLSRICSVVGFGQRARMLATRTGTPELFARPAIKSAEKRELIQDILNSTATKREARYYLKRYPLLDENNIYKHPDDQLTDANEKYDPYVDDLIDDHDDKPAPDSLVDAGDAGTEIHLADTIRVVLIRIRGLGDLPEDTIEGIGKTLEKCMKLGASPVLVMEDLPQDGKSRSAEMRESMELCHRLIKLLQDTCNFQLRPIQGLFQVDENGRSKFTMQEQIMVPLFQGIVPVLTPWVVDQKQLSEMKASSSDILKYAIENFGMLDRRFKAERNSDKEDFVTVEKVVFIDPLGGIPSLERYQSSHVFINLLQEYDSLLKEVPQCNLEKDDKERHLQNLKDMNKLLTLAPNASGIITTPKIATLQRHKKNTNPIIHNILTDRPTISSSLPVNLTKTPMLNTTILKKGTPVEVLLSDDGLDLRQLDREGKISLDKLKHLIDDSFGRDLDMDHYLNRINGKVSGLIIAGDYEAGAILTWETPPTDSSRKVAYLDKFAVLKKLQGLPGLADIVFKAMLLSFKEELVWRSRMDNPVNKWYFDRSVANCRVPQNHHWRMFYSGTGKPSAKDIEDYNGICASIVPSFRQ